MIGLNAVNEMKLLKNELEELAHKERAKISKAEVRLVQLEGRIWAVTESLRFWAGLDAEQALKEAIKASVEGEEALTASP